MHGGDLKRAVTDAVVDMLAQSQDSEHAERPVRAPESMERCARIVFRVMRNDLTEDDLWQMG